MVPTLREISNCREDEIREKIIENNIVLEKHPKNEPKQDRIYRHLFFCVLSLTQKVTS